MQNEVEIGCRWLASSVDELAWPQLEQEGVFYNVFVPSYCQSREQRMVQTDLMQGQARPRVLV
jgi:hypothetical protein